MQRTLRIVMVLCTCFVTGQAPGIAQDGTTPHPLQPSDTSRPRATISSFLAACNELYELAAIEQTPADFSDKVLPATARISDCLDLRSLPAELRDSAGLESAVYLKEVLDRITLPQIDQIPAATLNETDSVSRWRIPGTRLSIVRMADGAQQGAWLFSPETVRQAAQFYRAAAQLHYREADSTVSPGFHERYVALTKSQPTLTADTSSPRGTLTLFLDRTNQIYEIIRSEEYVDRDDPEYLPLVTEVFRCLDLSEIPEYSRDYYASEVAVCLKEVLDRVTLPSIEEVPGPENLQANEGAEPLTRWQIPNTKITIARITEGRRRGEYLFTAETVQRAVSMYAEVKSQPYRTEGRPVSEGLRDWYLSDPGNPVVAAWVRRFPDGVRLRAFGLAIWQWAGLLLAAFIGVGLMFAAYWGEGVRSERMRQKGLLQYWFTILFAVVAMLVPLVFKHVVWEYLSIRGTALYVADFAADTVFLMALIVVILSLSGRIADSVVALPKIEARGVDAALVRILFRVFGIVAAVIVFLEGGRYLGFPLTTLLASAGIGGLAIALSAQGMVKGLFGTVTILLDRPFRVGERIVANGHDGFVEEIGLRSTKIRSFLTNHLISIPNDQMADTEIENIGRRKHIRRLTDLHIPIDTPSDKVEQALAAIRAILQDHEGMDPEYPPRVYFNEFNPDSFNIRVICWYGPPDLWSYYAFCENVNLQIFPAFENQGIQFSLPIRQTYWKHDDEQGPLEVTVADYRSNAGMDVAGHGDLKSEAKAVHQDDKVE